MAQVCPMCADFWAPSFQLLQVHLFRVHAANFDLNCCDRRFKSAPAYRKHIQRYHRNATLSSSSSRSPALDSIEDENTNDDADDGYSVVHNDKANTAKWILKLKEKNKLTQSCVDGVLQDITEL